MLCAFIKNLLGKIGANSAQEGSKARRDELLKWQAAAQQKWEDVKIFEVDAPAEGEPGPPYNTARAFLYTHPVGMRRSGPLPQRLLMVMTLRCVQACLGADWPASCRRLHSRSPRIT